MLVLKVYGRFMPSQHDRDKWERIADPRNDMSQPQSSDWLIDSRGGTRTRDPGIMSETLTPLPRDSTTDDAA